MTESKDFIELSDDELSNVSGGVSYDVNDNEYEMTISQYNYYSYNGNILQCVGFDYLDGGHQTPLFDVLRPNDGYVLESRIKLSSFAGLTLTDPPLWARSRD